MALGRLTLLAVLCAIAAVACNSPPKIPVSTAALQRAYWGLPSAGPSADVTSQVTCPNGYPCDVFARGCPALC